MAATCECEWVFERRRWSALETLAMRLRTCHACGLPIPQMRWRKLQHVGILGDDVLTGQEEALGMVMLWSD